MIKIKKMVQSKKLLNKQAQLQIPFNLTETFPLQENSIMILFKKFYFMGTFWHHKTTIL